MTVMDKMQGTMERMTGDDTRANAAEVTTLQQSFNAMQIGLIKTEFFISQAQNPDVKRTLEGLRDDFLNVHLEKPKKILQKAGIQVMDLNVQERARNLPQGGTRVLRDEEILLDTVLSMQATIVGLQSGALSAVRGDVRDFFLNARDAAFDQWRKIGTTVIKVMPQVTPPSISGVQA